MTHAKHNGVGKQEGIVDQTVLRALAGGDWEGTNRYRIRNAEVPLAGVPHRQRGGHR